jgi:(2Fe-2S) ferredoxin/SAM-dependent methyltransferase
MEPFRFHLFVCTQQKPEGVPACSTSGSLANLDALKSELQSCGLGDEVQISVCGCMGLCEEGPIMVVYPEGVWYRHVQTADILAIVAQHLGGGEPVERLVWKDAPAMKAMAIEHEETFRAAMAAREKASVLPDHLYQLVRGFMPSRCLLTALELDIFTAVGEGANAGQVGRKIHADARAAAMLLNALTALELLSKCGDEYKNTPASARFFVQDSKDNQRNGLLHTANIWHRWSTLTAAVQRGSRIPAERDSTPEWTRNFIAGMQQVAQERAPLVVQALGTEGVCRILDLGGGSGAYSIAFAQASPKVQSEILDLPEVTELTAGYIQQSGIASRVRIRAGNMLTDNFGSGYDLILLNAICHMFSEAQNQELFRNARRALAPGGRLAVQDFILNSEKNGPLHAALFSLNMLVGTDGGASYSEPEYVAWMKAAGFAEVRRINLPGPSDLIVGSVQ